MGKKNRKDPKLPIAHSSDFDDSSPDIVLPAKKVPFLAGIEIPIAGISVSPSQSSGSSVSLKIGAQTESSSMRLKSGRLVSAVQTSKKDSLVVNSATTPVVAVSPLPSKLDLDETIYDFETCYEIECESCEPEKVKKLVEELLKKNGIPYRYSNANKFAISGPESFPCRPGNFRSRLTCNYHNCCVK